MWECAVSELVPFRYSIVRLGLLLVCLHRPGAKPDADGS